MRTIKSSFQVTVPYYHSNGLCYIIVDENPQKIDTKNIDEYSLAKCLVKTSTPRSLTRDQIFEVLNFLKLATDRYPKMDYVVVYSENHLYNSELAHLIQVYLEEIKAGYEHGFRYKINIERDILNRYLMWMQEFIKKV